jgi:hypothetical protein
VVSGTLLERVRLPPGVRSERVGELELRGKEERVVAWALSARAGG